MHFLKPSLIVSGIIGAGSLGTATTYTLTSETMENKVKDFCIPKGINHGEKGVWKKVHDKWKQNKTNKNFFKDIKDDSRDGNEIKNKCEGSYNSLYSVFFQKKDNLLEEIKEVCSINVKAALEETKLLKVEENQEEDKESFGENLKKFKNKQSVSNKELETIFEKYKNDQSIQDDSWKELQTWCRGSYSKNYTNNDDLELTKEFCLKKQ